MLSSKSFIAVHFTFTSMTHFEIICERSVLISYFPLQRGWEYQELNLGPRAGQAGAACIHCCVQMDVQLMQYHLLKDSIGLKLLWILCQRSSAHISESLSKSSPIIHSSICLFFYKYYTVLILSINSKLMYVAELH